MPASYPGSVKSFTTKIDGVDYVMAAHVNDLQAEVVAVETDLLGALVDYSAISTIVGWTTYTTKQIFLQKIANKMHWLQFYIDGTSNNVNTTFTIPIQSRIGMVQGGGVIAYDNSAPAPNAIISVPSGATTLSFYTNILGAGWTASGTKTIFGQLLILAN